MELFFEILIAALAVFGLWCAMRLMAELAFCSNEVTLAVCVLDSETKDSLGALLEQARAVLSYRRRVPIAVLYAASLLENGDIPEDVKQTARAFGARCYVVDSNEK